MRRIAVVIATLVGGCTEPIPVFWSQSGWQDEYSVVVGGRCSLPLDVSQCRPYLGQRTTPPQAGRNDLHLLSFPGP